MTRKAHDKTHVRNTAPETAPKAPAKDARKMPEPAQKVAPEKPDPTRFGDWEKNGRCIDF